MTAAALSSAAPYRQLSADSDSDSDARAPPSLIVQFLQTLRRIGIQGVGFFSDAYDLFIINIVISIIGKEITLKSWEKSIISTSALIGAVLGQLTFGFLADKIGRRLGFIMTLCIIVFAAGLSAVSPPIPATHKVIIALCVFRALLGIGIGGEYPLSASITAEQSDKSNRGRMIAAVFSMQGMGYLAAAVVAVVLLKTVHSLELAWRLCLGIGCVPGVLSMYFRIKMHETKAFKKSKEKTSFWEALRTYWIRLLGTAGTWFLLDVVFYANGLFSSAILAVFGVGKNAPTPQKQLADIAEWNVYLALMALPGYWVAVWLVEVPMFGRRNTQLLGFFLLFVLYTLIASLYPLLHKAPVAFLIIYGLTFFVSNAGANTTTFIVPSELFPTRIRATFHGISAAAGKLGAIAGGYSIAFLAPDHPRLVFVICGSIALAGLALTWFAIEETQGRALEEINAEPARKHFSWRRGVVLVSGNNDGPNIALRPVR